MKLHRDSAVLVVVDVQEGFRPAVLDFDEIAANIGKLVQGANALGVPVRVTEQYPKGLGRTVPEVADHLLEVEPLEKTVFSAVGAAGFQIDGDRDQAIVCGIESHVCVWQTAHDLIACDLEVHVVRDAVTSRTAANRDLGIELVEQAGGRPTSVETALFELLGEAGSAEFKTVQKLIK